MAHTDNKPERKNNKWVLKSVGGNDKIKNTAFR